MISLLLPTRNRFEDCNRTIKSFFENAKNSQNLQLILRCDNDDLEFLKNIHKLDHIEKLTIIVGDKYDGYKSLHKFYNEMINFASGDYIMPINDDLICETKGFDEIIMSKNKEDIKIYVGVSNGNYQGWYFPIIQKKIIQEIGHLSKSPFYDGYLYFSLNKLGIYEEIDINFTHHVLNDNLTENKNKVLLEINTKVKNLDLFEDDMNNITKKISRLL